MQGDYPNYQVEENEVIRATFYNPTSNSLEKRVIPGPQYVRISTEADQPGIGHMIRMQIGFGGGSVEMVAPNFEGTVFRR